MLVTLWKLMKHSWGHVVRKTIETMDREFKQRRRRQQRELQQKQQLSTSVTLFDIFLIELQGFLSRQFLVPGLIMRMGDIFCLKLKLVTAK